MNSYQRRLLQNRVAGIQLVGAMAAQSQAGGGVLRYLAHPQAQQQAAVQAGLINAGVHPAVAAMAASQGGGDVLSGLTPQGNPISAIQTSPDRTNRFPFPMPSATVAATSAGVSNATAQIPTKPVRLVMSESTGPSSLTDISIATTPQFASLTGNFPITAFGATATDSLIGFDTAQTGQSIVLSLFNSGGASTVVLSGFFCDVAL